MTEWRCNLVEDFMLGTTAIVIHRQLGDFTEVLRFGEGVVIIDRLDPSVRIDMSKMPHVPTEALATLGAAITPGPSLAEMARIEEALNVERRRVDQVLDRRVQS